MKTADMKPILQKLYINHLRITTSLVNMRVYNHFKAELHPKMGDSTCLPPPHLAVIWHRGGGAAGSWLWSHTASLLVSLRQDGGGSSTQSPWVMTLLDTWIGKCPNIKSAATVFAVSNFSEGAWSSALTQIISQWCVKMPNVYKLV